MLTTLTSSAWLLCVALLFQPAPGSVADYARDLAAARMPPVELALVDDYVAFERGLHSVLTGPSAQDPDLLQRLGAGVAETSPMALRRSFSDGREPTGWDLAQAWAQAELAARRPELAPLLEDVTRLLSPDVWQVAEGAARLARLCEQAPDEPVVAALVFQTAERLAPFPQYRAAVDEVLTAAFAALDASAGANANANANAEAEAEAEAGGEGGAAGGVDEVWLHGSARTRHLLELAVLRVSSAAAGRGASDVDQAHWRAAAATAPTPWQSSLVTLTGLVLRARQGDVAQQARARDELASYIGETPFSDLALRAGEQLTRRWLTQGNLTQALGWCALMEREGAAAEQLAGLRLIMLRDGHALLPSQPDAVLDQLEAQLGRSMDALGDGPAAPALAWAAATLAQARGQDQRAHELLIACAAASLSGAQPSARLSPISEWWVPLGEPAAQHLRPLEFSRGACWQLADQALADERWEDVLRYGAFPAPAEGCGNVIVEAERHGLRRRAAALQGLGRRDEALQLRGQLLLSAGFNDITRAAVELVDQSVQVGDEDALRVWLERSAPGSDERLDKTSRYLAFRVALRDGPREEAERLGAELGQRWPGDDLLNSRVRHQLAGDG
ncbi:MAG: hypothetical protein DRQ55_12040 [Planctomycetota bacterium]|nr:MAG: hypothetical protein DRQ55_12040 [Planctomycetota bacterium]